MEIDRVSDDDSSPNSILNLALNSDMEELHENVAVSRESLPMLTGPSYSGALVPATAGHDLVPMTRRHQQRQRKLQVSWFQFSFFDTIGLTNLSNLWSYIVPRVFVIIQSTFYRLIKGQQHFTVIQIA